MEDNNNQAEAIQNTSNPDTIDNTEQGNLTLPTIKLSRRAKKDLLEWRRAQVITNYAAGKTIPEIRRLLQVSERTVQRDLRFLRQQARETLSQQIEEVLPFEHQKRIANVEKVIRELWQLYERAEEARERRAVLDSLVQATLVRASLDADAGSLDRSLKAILAMKKKVMKSKDDTTEHEVAAS
jgi:transposase